LKSLYVHSPKWLRLVAVLAIVTFISAWAMASGDAAAPTSLSASVGTATVSPPIVVRSTTSVVVTALVTGSFKADESPSSATVGAWEAASGSPGTCTKGSTTYALNEKATATRTVVTYIDKHVIVDGTAAAGATATATDDVVVTGLADGSHTATLSTVVQAKQTKVTTTQTTTNYRHHDGTRAQCSVDGTVWAYSSDTEVDEVSTATTVTKTASFVVDIQPPTVTARFSGNSSTAPSEPIGGSIKANVQITTATPADTFVLLLEGVDEGNIVRFSQTTNGTVGNNGSEGFPSISLDIPCAAPLGKYNLRVTVTQLTDRGGTDFDPVVVDAGEFFVILPSRDLTGSTAVFGFVDVDGDGIADYTNLDASGFTAVKGGKSVNTSPGAFHVTSLMEATGACLGQTTMLFSSTPGADGTADVILRAPAGFAFVTTGQTYAKVYAGRTIPNTLFDFERPVLTGISASGDVTSLLGAGFESVNSSTMPTVLSVKLGKLDTLYSGGALPTDAKVFVRARVRYVGTTVPAVGTVFAFEGTVHVDGYNGLLLEDSSVDTYNLTRK
jgi:hypothetical protein